MSEPGADQRPLPRLLDVSDGLTDAVRDALGFFERVAGWGSDRLERELALDQRRLSIVRASGRTRRSAHFLVEPERRIELYPGAFDGLSGRFAPDSYLVGTLLHELAHVWDEATQFVLSSALLAATGGIWREPTYVAGPRGSKMPVTTRSGHVDPYEDLAESVACVLVGDQYLDGKQGRVDRVRERYLRRVFAGGRSREQALEFARRRTSGVAQDGVPSDGP